MEHLEQPVIYDDDSNLLLDSWKKKNIMTLNTIPLFILPIILTPLLLEKGFLMDTFSDILQINKGFIIGCGN